MICFIIYCLNCIRHGSNATYERGPLKVDRSVKTPWQEYVYGVVADSFEVRKIISFSPHGRAIEKEWDEVTCDVI